MFNSVRLDKNDIKQIESIVEHLQSVLTWSNKYNQDIFKDDMVEGFKPMMKMNKAISKELKANNEIDLTRFNIRKYYIRAVKSIEAWGERYNTELVKIIVENGVQAVLKSTDTKEGFTFTLNSVA